MSISSWPRMWQCHTYSHPKSVSALAIGVVRRSRFGSDVFEAPGLAERHRRVERPQAIRHSEGDLRNDRPQSDDGVLERTHPDRVFPPEFVRIGLKDPAVPGDPVEKLHIKEVEVDRMRVHPVVCDFPDLCSVSGRGDLATWRLPEGSSGSRSSRAMKPSPFRMGGLM